MGFALYLAQLGDRHPEAVPLQGFGNAKVLEMIVAFDGNAFRLVYTVQFGSGIYVLHAFQKKSTRGIQTPSRHRNTIRERLAHARSDHSKRR